MKLNRRDIVQTRVINLFAIRYSYKQTNFNQRINES